MNDVMKALEAAINENPEDVVPQMALNDLLQEIGKTPLAAKRYVNRVVREATTKKRLALARKRVTEGSHRGAHLRGRIREAAGVGGSVAPITVEPGKAAPQSTGEAGYSQFKNGGRCSHPGAAKRAGYKVRYVRSTLTVNVGHEWVISETANWRK